MPVAKRTFEYWFRVLLLAAVSVSSAAQDEAARPNAHGILANDFQAPISFEPNWGQADSRVKFMARGSGYSLFLTPSNALLSLGQSILSDDLAPTNTNVITMNMVGASPASKITGRDELPGKSSYFMGSDPSHWRTNIPTFRKVEYEDIYPGIDLVYHGVGGQLEYDFVLHPGANPNTIAIEFTGEKKIRITPRGELVLETESGRICFHAPVAYQGEQGNRSAVPARYRWIHKRQIGFVVSAYDSKKTLIIDPVLTAQRLAEAHPWTHPNREARVPASNPGLNLVDQSGRGISAFQEGAYDQIQN